MKVPTSRRLTAVLVLIIALGAAVVWNSVFVVDQGWQAVVLRFGRPFAVVDGSDCGAGLYVKAPFADRVIRLDRRDQLLESRAQDVVLADQSRLQVQPLMRYRIVDPMSFYRVTGAGRAGASRLEGLLDATLRQVLAGATVRDLATGRRDALMMQVRSAVAQAAQALGVRVADVRLLRASPTEADAQFVYRRMAAGETQQAAQIRSQGEQRKHDLMAAADRDAALIRAQAQAQATQIRAQGEAERANILAKAYAFDPAFARYSDTLAAYKTTLGQGGVTLVLTPGSGFLRDFGAPLTVGK